MEKEKKSDMIFTLIIMLLLIISILLNTFIPRKHICIDGIGIKTADPMDFTHMFEQCLMNCNNNNVECIQTCTIVLDYMGNYSKEALNNGKE